MAQLDLTLLGRFQARLKSGPTIRVPTRKAQGLLAYLALPCGRAHPRDKLAALLWGDMRQGQARTNLRQALFNLREALTLTAPESLYQDGGHVSLNSAAIDVDVATFEDLVRQGTPEAVARAAAIYQGDLLEGLSVHEAPFEEWLMAERERLRELALETLAKLLAHQRAAGSTELALQTALRLIALDPLLETVHRTLMRLYAQLGRRPAALRQYQQCVGVLKRELGVEPEGETRDLYHDLLRWRPAIGAKARGPGVTGSPAFGSSPIALLTIPIDIPLIGRGQEMACLRETLAKTRSAGHVVLVVGEAGVGKTRLIEELAMEALRASWGRVLLGRAHEGEQVLPFGPWVNAFRAGHVGDEVASRGSRAPWQDDLAGLLPELGSRRGGAPTRPPDHLRVFEGVAQLVGHLAASAPVLLMLEDLHWADEMSLRLLGFLARRIQTWPALVIATARDDEVTDTPMLRSTLESLEREVHVTKLVLAPLSQEDTRALVRMYAGSSCEKVDLPGLADQIWQTSEGSPFVAIEALRALEHGPLVLDSAKPSLPERVSGFITRRLDRLDERGRQLVAVASVIDRDFEFALVRHAAGLEEREAAEAVEELVRRHLLQALGDRFDFTHDRIRAAAYNQLLEPRRTLCHRQVAEALEGLYAANLEPYAVALATHYHGGKVWDKALRYWRQAGIQAVARSANREAAACFEQALAVVPHLPETRARQEEEADLRLELRTPLHALGQVARGDACAKEAHHLAGKLGDPRRLALASVYLCHYSRLYGCLAEAIAFGQRALAIADELDEVRLGVSASFSLGLAHSYLGDYSEAGELFRRTINAVEGNRLDGDCCGLDGLPAVMAPAHLARMLAECGRFEEGAVLGKKAVAVGEALDHPYSLVMACWGLGWLCNIRGAFDDAITLLERACAIARKWEFAVWLPNCLEELGFAYACTGRLDEGVRLLEESFEGYIGGGRRPLTTHMGEAYLLAGRPDDAMTLAEETLTLSRRGHERRMEAFALALLGEIGCRREPGPSPGSEVCYLEAATLAEALGMRPLVAHCHVGLGKLYGRAGKSEQAQTQLAIGTGMYREMGMRFWLEEAEAQMSAGPHAQR